MPAKKDPKLARIGAKSYNKPVRTPNHKTKSHAVVARYKEGGQTKTKTIRFGQQGASTAGAPKKGESKKTTQRRANFKSRHSKNIAKGRSSAAWWADRTKWS
jgi:hypothetical protein